MSKDTGSKALDADGPNFAIDTICDAILEGMSYREIAASVDVSKSKLIRWIAARPDRTTRVREARALTAALWDEEAEHVIREAECHPVEMQRARELAQHLRWRASKVAPAEYGDRVAVEHTVDVAERLESLRRKALLPRESGESAP